MTLSKATDFLESPLFLRLLGIGLAGAGLFGIAKGLFGSMDEGELWWGYVGIGIVSIGFSAGPLIWAHAEAEMRLDRERADKEEHRPSDSKVNTTERTLH